MNDVHEDSIIHFPEGLPGFEQCRRFVLVSSEEIAPLQYLQGIDAPQPSFLTVDPALVLPSYRCVLGESDRARLGTEAAELVHLALVTVNGGDGAVVNLRAPVVVNSKRMVGLQVIPYDSSYPISHPLVAS